MTMQKTVLTIEITLATAFVARHTTHGTVEVAVEITWSLYEEGGPRESMLRAVEIDGARPYMTTELDAALSALGAPRQRDLTDIEKAQVVAKRSADEAAKRARAEVARLEIIATLERNDSPEKLLVQRFEAGCLPAQELDETLAADLAGCFAEPLSEQIEGAGAENDDECESCVDSPSLTADQYRRFMALCHACPDGVALTAKRFVVASDDGDELRSRTFAQAVRHVGGVTVSIDLAI